MKIKAIAIVAFVSFLFNESYSQSENFESLITKLQDKDSYDILYTVQIGAFKEDHSSGYFSEVEDLFSSYYKDGFTRFYTKLFRSLQNAVTYRDDIRQRYPDAFVLGLDGGFDRILIEVD